MAEQIKTPNQTLLLILFAALVLPVASLTTHARAADRPDVTDQTTDANYVGGHRFSPSFLVLTPFAKPMVSTGLFMAITHPKSAANEDLDVAGIAPSVEGHIPIIRNLVLDLKVSGLAAAGLNSVSALNYGASTGSRLQLGVLYQFVDTPKAVVTGALTVGKPHLYSVSPLISAGQYLRNVLQGTSSDVLFSTESTQWYPSVRFAYAINPTFGLQGVVGGQFFSSSETVDSRSQLTLSLGFDTQLKPTTNVPLAFQAMYVRNQVLTRQGNQDTNTYAFSVFETISPRFNFGTEFGWISLPNNTSFALGVMGRYYY